MKLTQELVGTWQAVSAVVSGQSLSGDTVNTIRLILTATRFTTRRGSETLFDSTYTADSTQSPMHIEMIGVEEFAGKPALGIYELKGEMLQLCYKMPGFPRPADFESQDGSGAFLITLKRVE